MNKKFAFAMAAMFAISLVGCPAAEKDKGPIQAGLTGDPSEPDWVGLGSGMYPGDSGAVLYATGYAQAGKNLNAQQQQARTRAQENLASQIGAKVKSLTQEYIDQFKDYYVEGSESSLEGFKKCTEIQVNEYLAGANPIAFWVCHEPKTEEYKGAYFILLRLDPNAVFTKYKEEVKNKARAQAEATREKVKGDMEAMLGEMSGKLDDKFNVYVAEAEKAEKPKITIK